MPVGIVKNWSDQGGYGFIESPGERDVFCHAKNLEGCSELIPGQTVEYERTFDRDRQKWHAVGVRVI